MMPSGWASYCAGCDCSHCVKCKHQKELDDEFDNAAEFKVKGKDIAMVKARGRGEDWYSEEYAVQPALVEGILAFCSLSGEMMTDAFSSESNKRFEKRLHDAWVCSWSPPLWIWCNPPFSKFNDVFIKWLAENARGVVVAPHWRTSWHQILMRIATKHKWYPAGTEFFELDGVKAGPIRWPVDVFFIDGFLLQTCATHPITMVVGKEIRDSDAARRRRRRERSLQLNVKQDLD